MSARKYYVWQVDCDECGETFDAQDVEPDECPCCGQPLEN